MCYLTLLDYISLYNGSIKLMPCRKNERKNKRKNKRKKERKNKRERLLGNSMSLADHKNTQREKLGA